MNSGKVFRKTCTVHYFRALVLTPEHYFDQLIWSSTKFLMFDKIITCVRFFHTQVRYSTCKLKKCNKEIFSKTQKRKTKV